MSGDEDLGQPQRYCTNCGVSVRLGNAYCVSCGASLTPGPGPSGGSVYSAGGLGRGSWGAAGQPGGPSSRSRTDDLRRVPLGVGRWFGRLPLAAKAALAATVLVALLAALSPVAPMVAAVAFCVSLVAVIVRIGQRRSIVRWGVAAAVSLVFAVALAGVAGIFYDGGSTSETQAGSRGGGYAEGDGGYGGAPSPDGGAEDSGDESGGRYTNPVEVYLVMNDAFFMDGYLLVNQTSEGRFFHAHNLDHAPYAHGEVLADGRLYLHGDVGDLDYLEYACTYDADDPRGEAAMQEACGFSPSEE